MHKLLFKDRITAPISKGQISGLGKDGYIYALNYFIHEIISE